MSLKYEACSEPLHNFEKKLFSNRDSAGDRLLTVDGVDVDRLDFPDVFQVRSQNALVTVFWKVNPPKKSSTYRTVIPETQNSKPGTRNPKTGI